ncbi:MAG: hypothetical protein LCI00_03340 [Chloroflexi bacterium]|nr:hypothetical protein [Chloroflexota bacterium]MCC6891341.1 hypothetical protein [Anaerolineae bacterium]
MDRSTWVIVIVLVISIAGSFPATRLSKKKQQIYGGTLGEIFHYLGVLAYIGVAPAALLGTFLVGPLRFGIPLALTFLAVAFVMLLGYGVVERSARVGVQIDDHLWTQEDAKTSGL